MNLQAPASRQEHISADFHATARSLDTAAAAVTWFRFTSLTGQTQTVPYRDVARMLLHTALFADCCTQGTLNFPNLFFKLNILSPQTAQIQRYTRD
jgi:hypothetical protein